MLTMTFSKLKTHVNILLYIQIYPEPELVPASSQSHGQGLVVTELCFRQGRILPPPSQNARF